MIETREKKIKNKIFTKKDIRNIWSIFNSQYVLSKKENDRASFNIQVRCADETRYESDGDDLLSEGKIFDLKKVESINFMYYSYAEDKHIDFDLKHGDYTYYNLLKVKGSDEHWVAGIFSKFEILLNSIKPQNNWLITYKISTLLIVGFIFSLFLFTVIVDFSPHYSEFTITTLSVAKFIDGLFPSLIVGYSLSFFLVGWVVKLWPSIEFDFGPEHKKKEKNKRTRIWIFITIIVLPVFGILF